MQVESKLRPMFSYNIILIISFIILLTLFIIIYKKYIKHSKFKKDKNKIALNKKIDINKLKEKYLLKLNTLLKEFNDNKIDNRMAYQSLSKLVRTFIYETTDIKVQNYTLSEIKDLNIKVLYELIYEYYQPEFKEISKGNIINSINIAKEVIIKWK